MGLDTLAGIYLDEMFGPAVAQRLAARAGPLDLRVDLGAPLQPGERDSAVLNDAALHRLVLLTRNVVDFPRLHEHWVMARDWGLVSAPHAGILILAGREEEVVWADMVMDLLLHPGCPPLDDQLLLWRAADRRWEWDHPFSRQRRRVLAL